MPPPPRLPHPSQTRARFIELAEAAGFGLVAERDIGKEYSVVARNYNNKAPPLPPIPSAGDDRHYGFAGGTARRILTVQGASMTPGFYCYGRVAGWGGGFHTCRHRDFQRCSTQAMRECTQLSPLTPSSWMLLVKVSRAQLGVVVPLAISDGCFPRVNYQAR